MTTEHLDHEIEPQRITIREVYQSVQGLRRELASRIDGVEKVGISERLAIRGDLDHLKESVVNQIGTAQAQVAGISAQVRQVDASRQLLEDRIAPVITYITKLQAEDDARARWRTKTFNFVFGAGLVSIVGAICAILALLHSLGVI